MQEARRYACYSVAEGCNPTSNISDTRLTMEFNATNYFKDVFPTLAQMKTKSSKKRFKMAYLILISDGQGFHQVSKLVEILDDGQAILLIHVIQGLEAEFDKIKALLDKRRRNRVNMESGNVHMAKRRFSNIWGHSSLLFTELSGFFELRDLAEWDYVVNLSNYDWPLRTNSEIHKVLGSFKSDNRTETRIFLD